MSYRIEKKEDYTLYHNEGGATIGVSNCPIIEQDGYIFKDLERTGELLPYEDWRLDADTRAEDLAKRLTVEEIAGLMIYSPHQMVPGFSKGLFIGTYNGTSLEESGKEAWDLTDQQLKMLETDHIRHILVATIRDAYTTAKWSNRMQAYAESLPHGIPINVSSDPRHGAGKAAVEFKSEAKSVSKWPEGLGLASTFDAKICKSYAETVATEYRALGITTALSPQIDLGTEPRWMRFEDTFGCDPELVTAFAKAYCDGLQTTKDSENGWGNDSVCAMVKHWPGGGPCEAGRDAHYSYGKFSVFPGGCFEEHQKPFVEGAFKLDGPTKQAASVMPYYTVSWDMDTKDGENVGNSYSHYLISDLLRERYGYEGVVCTDWGITQDPSPDVADFGSRCFGVEHLTEAERHFRIIENGADQFGGNSDVIPLLEAYKIGSKKYGEVWMRKRFEQSAKRLLKNMFLCGLYDNAYLDPEESKKTVGCQEFCEKGFEAQLKSVVLLKNNDVLPLKKKIKVYVPERKILAGKTFFRTDDPEKTLPGASKEVVSQYFEWADTPEEADAALVFMESPISEGYSVEDRAQGGNGYMPISLQYRPYEAVHARMTSIAGGDFRENFINRSYAGKTGTARNESDLDNLIRAKEVMKEKPVIAFVRMHHAMVMSEMEPYADAIVADFGVQQEALLQIITGMVEPQGRLPIQLPKDMETVEKHCEDKPFDLEPYMDSNGNKYDYGYGMNWRGIIK